MEPEDKLYDDAVIFDLLKKTEDLGKIGSWLYDIVTKQFIWSHGMYTLFGIEEGKPVRPEIYIASAAEDNVMVAKTLIKNIETDHVAINTIIKIKANGTQKILSVKADVEIDENNKAIRIYGIDQEISANGNGHNETEQELHRLNTQINLKNRELLGLASDIKTFNNIASHEFEDSLKKIYTGLEYIAVNDAKKLSNEARANVRRVQASVQKMKLITADIVTYTNIHSNGEEKKQQDINHVIDQITNDLKSRRGDINLNIQKDSPITVCAYNSLLIPLVHHIIDNAFKFNNSEVIELNINCSEQEVGENDDGLKKFTAVSFKDNGIGLGTDDAVRIFDIFTKLHDKSYRGSGIGLAICKKIMDIHYGFIKAESLNGSGTTITCYFPNY